MGSPAVRITREEILTAPEFQGLTSTADPASRVGGARLELVRVGHETQMGSCYQQIPLRVMPPFNLDCEPAALLYLINLTAGLMDGDAHLIALTARAGTRAVVTGQSASRVHPAVHSLATQQWHVQVEEEACLVVLPGPTIPYRQARYFQHSRVEIAPSARLLWGDIWLAGRYDRGDLSERFEFERIVQDFEVRRAGRLVYRERFRWDGPWDRAASEWYFGGCLACASLFVGGPLPVTLPPPPSSVRRVICPLDNGESCLRWCGHPTEVTMDVALTALQVAATWTSGPDAPPWLLASGGLAPNHWFASFS